MVQQEVKKKTRIYGTVAAVSAMVLVALIFVFGSAPVILPPTEMPTVSAMKTFSSYEELKNFLAVNASEGYYGYGGSPLDAEFFAERAPNLAPVPEPVPAQASSSGQTDSYSTTNIQVAGVDEADTVKNDGKYIYTVSTEYDYPTMWNVIYIVKADPQDPKVIAKITFDNNTYPAGIFLSEDSSRLAVLASQYQVIAYDATRSEVAMIYPYQSEVNTFIYVYDISDKAYPVLARNFTISGSYFNSRMIGNYVYAVVSQPAYVLNDVVTLPRVYQETKVSDVAPSSVYYADTIPSYFTFTTFIGLNILDDAQEPTNMTIMMGGTSAMYVSMNNIYVTYPTWSEQGQYTSIYRVRVNGSALAFEAKGSVAGYVLNQYSMDEHNGYFRVATTWQKNNVYVLNMNLSLVGKLENLAEGESIYSVRFMGNKGYVVTFRQTDPFFVIDLNNPTDPKVAGELKIPGYSSYLHPYDENHVIGLGKENNTVKLSLFDVTNVNAPTETAKYIVNGDPADSQALQDPKAFLFDKQKELLVIPMSITQYSYINITEEERARGEVSLQQSFWQGAYVFNLNLNNGFVLRGNVTHIEDNSEQKPPPYYQINRALYIGNTLYTVSNERVQLNSLENLALIAEVDLS
jgi:inhibitor of cysteine peptidase